MPGPVADSNSSLCDSENDERVFAELDERVFAELDEAVSRTTGYDVTLEIENFFNFFDWNLTHPHRGRAKYLCGGGGQKGEKKDLTSTRLFCKMQSTSRTDGPTYSFVVKSRGYFEINLLKNGVLYTLSSLITGCEYFDLIADPRSDKLLLVKHLWTIMERLYQLHLDDRVHCDVKPENVIIPEKGPAKLIDHALMCLRTDGILHRGTPYYAFVGIFLEWGENSYYNNPFIVDLWPLMVMTSIIYLSGELPYQRPMLFWGFTPEQVGQWWDNNFTTWLGEIESERSNVIKSEKPQEQELVHLDHLECTVRLAQELHECAKSPTGTLAMILERYGRCNFNRSA